ncbi:DNA-binding transcriptional MerR regulator [Acidovorax soli]|uniref:DNA-binding transcriptional MerR regulator n=1 Tax=Acidovorax soli TaxID=592050 RepID=A0A7X0UD87_9BURK|nr:MerR family transcriptional regulator [Acidovorax soli]MBB6564226.1 DNA-binding transcriptional MerR regulator [Acidovorax soli]
MSGGDDHQGRRQPGRGGLLRIGELAALSGRSVHAIRWYEAQGLMPNVARDAAGRRVYHTRHLDWLQLMERLRHTGMSIAEMRQYTDLVCQGRASLRQRKDLLLAHRARAQATIAEWLQALELIDGKIAFYDEWIGTGQPPRVLPHEQARPAALTAPTGKPKRRRASKD